MKNLSIAAFIISLMTVFTGCRSTEMNLNDCKRTVREIYNSGRYREELQRSVSKGETEIILPSSGKAAIVFDVDETSLSNYSYLNSIDFGFIPEDWDRWILQEKAEAIAPVLELYKRLSQKGVHTIFITGRTASQYEATFNNLVSQGYTKFDTLIVRQKSGANINAASTKELERKRLAEAGYTIVACVGDQWSDMSGSYTGVKIKLPNYIYFIP